LTFVRVFCFQILLFASGVFLTCEPTGAQNDLSLTYRVSAERIVQVRISEPKLYITKQQIDILLMRLFVWPMCLTHVLPYRTPVTMWRLGVRNKSFWKSTCYRQTWHATTVLRQGKYTTLRHVLYKCNNDNNRLDNSNIVYKMCNKCNIYAIILQLLLQVGMAVRVMTNNLSIITVNF